MFGIKQLKEMVLLLSEKDDIHDQQIAVLQKQSHTHSDTVIKCDTCKCLIEKQDAVEGDSVIKDSQTAMGLIYNVRPVKYLHTPHYCLRCAPKLAKVKT